VYDIAFESPVNKMQDSEALVNLNKVIQTVLPLVQNNPDAFPVIILFGAISITPLSAILSSFARIVGLTALSTATLTSSLKPFKEITSSDTFPYSVSRYNTAPDEVFGRGLAMQCIDDVISLNGFSDDVSVAVDKAVKL
jgi:hypothetical protein